MKTLIGEVEEGEDEVIPNYFNSRDLSVTFISQPTAMHLFLFSSANRLKSAQRH